MTNAEHFFNRLFNRFGIVPIVISILFIIAFFARFSIFKELGVSFLIYSTILKIVYIIIYWIIFEKLHKILNVKIPYENGVIQRFLIEFFIEIILVAIGWWVLILIMIQWNMPLFVVTPQLKALTFMIFSLVTGLINAGFLVQYYFERWKQTLIQSERLKRQVAAVQLENLINQVNPHFLFNSLTSLSSLIGDDPDLARKFVGQLSKVYRYVLQHREKELVSLSEEALFIRSYTFLLEARYQQGIKIDLSPALLHENRKIVPVTLQILIENAIKHNMISANTPLHIWISIENEHLIVGNSLNLRPSVPESNRSGLANLVKLYGFLSTNAVVVEETTTAFTVRVPLLATSL